ncbi:Pentatricopeptide repeat-containing protein [Canna indica]|uniref:Pentatricopeptide repeat-containing protein n=1 Tax=Canna indica TaxID=4628 RepID=A0AAQ3K3Z0_9LILI|nr:Pentatricopeptide repeat-containing protein [Canna indica]
MVYFVGHVTSSYRWKAMIRRAAPRRSLRELKRVHGLMVVKGFNSDLQCLGDLLLSAVCSLHVEYAYQLFAQITQPDLFMWNTVIRGAAHSSDPLQAASLYARMAETGLRPDSFSFLFLFKACAKLKSSSAAAAGAQFHAVCTKLGFESDAFVRNSLINLHARCGDLGVAMALFDGPAKRDVVARSALILGYARKGDLSVARQLFDESPCRDVVSWNIMISAYSSHGEMEKARELFDAAAERDVVSWNTMIAGYAQCGLHAQALEVYEEMQTAGWKPDEATLVSLLSSCSNSGALALGQRIHWSLLESCSRNGLSLLLGNALIGMYAKCGCVDRALQVFEGMTERDLWTWNSVIGGLAFHGRAADSIRIFEQMQGAKISPNEITFVAVLAACSHSGLVKEGRRYFSLMINEYGMEPNIKHYGCMVDMLGRAGFLREALEFVEWMKVEPSDIIWRTLLGACKVHGNIELAEHARKQILAMQKDASGDYVLLSNVYALTGKWGAVEETRKSMDERGLRKAAAHTVV